jgi:hypothetical protein
MRDFLRLLGFTQCLHVGFPESLHSADASFRTHNGLTAREAITAVRNELTDEKRSLAFRQQVEQHKDDLRERIDGSGRARCAACRG